MEKLEISQEREILIVLALNDKLSAVPFKEVKAMSLRCGINPGRSRDLTKDALLEEYLDNLEKYDGLASMGVSSRVPSIHRKMVDAVIHEGKKWKSFDQKPSKENKVKVVNKNEKEKGLAFSFGKKESIGRRERRPWDKKEEGDISFGRGDRRGKTKKTRGDSFARRVNQESKRFEGESDGFSITDYLQELYGDGARDLCAAATSFDSEIAIDAVETLCREFKPCCNHNRLNEDESHELKAILDSLLDFVFSVKRHRENSIVTRTSLKLRHVHRSLQSAFWSAASIAVGTGRY